MSTKTHSRAARQGALGAVVCAALGGLAGCGADDAAPGFAERDGQTVFPEAAGLVAESEQEHFVVEVRSAPQAVPQRGDNRVQLNLKAVHEPFDYSTIELELSPFMPAMGHGAAIAPVLAFADAGRFEFRDVWLTMPGRWELRVAVSGEVTDRVTFEFDVE